MREKIKNGLIVVFAVIIILLLIKMYDYNTGIMGDYPIKGTYALITDNPSEQLYLSINAEEGIYYHVKHSDKLIQSGSFDRGKFYTLYENDTELIYGKIIKSYKKIYFIDKDFNIAVYEKLLDELLIPPY